MRKPGATSPPPSSYRRTTSLAPVRCSILPVIGVVPGEPFGNAPGEPLGVPEGPELQARTRPASRTPRTPGRGVRVMAARTTDGPNGFRIRWLTPACAGGGSPIEAGFAA